MSKCIEVLFFEFFCQIVNYDVDAVVVGCC